MRRPKSGSSTMLSPALQYRGKSSLLGGSTTSNGETSDRCQEIRSLAHGVNLPLEHSAWLFVQGFPQ